jgi:hypothetical protein
MLDRQKGDIVFQCDGCFAVLETNQVDWGTPRNIIKKSGWEAQESGEEWVHFCPKCIGCKDQGPILWSRKDDK